MCVLMDGCCHFCPPRWQRHRGMHCICMRMPKSVHISAQLCAYTVTYSGTAVVTIAAHLHTQDCTQVDTKSLCTHLHTHVQTFVHLDFKWESGRKYVHMWVLTCLHTCRHTRLHTCLHTCVFGCLCVCLWTSQHIFPWPLIQPPSALYKCQCSRTAAFAASALSAIAASFGVNLPVQIFIGVPVHMTLHRGQKGAPLFCNARCSSWVKHKTGTQLAFVMSGQYRPLRLPLPLPLPVGFCHHFEGARRLPAVTGATGAADRATVATKVTIGGD